MFQQGKTSRCVGSNPVSSKIAIDGNGVKAMPGSIPSSSHGSIIKVYGKNKGIQIGHTKKVQIKGFSMEYSPTFKTTHSLHGPHC